MCDDRKWSVRLMLWAALLMGGLLGLSACAGEPPSSVGLLCLAGEDSDDGGCWGDGIICSNDFCRETGKACPTTCGSHFDCRAAEDCGAKVACKDGKCIDPNDNNDCPSTCSNDSDCDDCPDGKKKCESGTCTASPDKCPDSCESNSDCPPSDCGTKTTCHPTDKICITGPNLCKMNDCKNLADCVGCPDDKKACKNGTCVKPLPTDQVYLCGGGKTCSTGWSCGAEGPTKNTCTKPCQSNTDCDDGKGNYFCFTPQGKTNGACHIACKNNQCPAANLTCCTKTPPGAPSPFCITPTGNCPP